ncbi:MAG: hypothetical protein ACOYMR_12135 [Ilumatobacteraceae bacterium]|jgi:hypothetical protein
MSQAPQPKARGGQASRRRKSKRGGAAPQSQKIDLWKDPAPLPDVEPIAVPHEVGAMLRSLGDPPMNNGAAAGRFFSVVIERAAAVAVALAVSADVLARDD